MRKSIAGLLLLTMSVGCSTTTRARPTAAPPAISSRVATTIYGRVLIDGTEVEFQGPAEVRADGSVQGSARRGYAGQLEGARAYRLAVYEADQIASYKVGKESGAGNAFAVTFLAVAGVVGRIVILANAKEMSIGIGTSTGGGGWNSMSYRHKQNSRNGRTSSFEPDPARWSSQELELEPKRLFPAPFAG